MAFAGEKYGTIQIMMHFSMANIGQALAMVILRSCVGFVLPVMMNAKNDNWAFLLMTC